VEFAVLVAFNIALLGFVINNTYRIGRLTGLVERYARDSNPGKEVKSGS
jgi:hypothetical protein